MLSNDQINTLFSLIDRQIVLFAASTMGPQVLSNDEKQILKDNKIDIDDLYSVSKDIAYLNYQLGLLSNVLGDQRTKSLSFNELVKFIETGNNFPLNEREKMTIESIKMQSMADIRAARGRIFQDINNVVQKTLYDARSNQEEFIKNAIVQGTSNRKSRKVIAKEIARLAGDWSRNFNKSVQFISHTALNEGRAAIVEKRYGSNEAKVYFLVQKDACSYCKKLYLKENDEPIVFTLRELQANGTNIGRKQKEWLPTLSAIHPYCRCTVHEFREGMEWDGEKFIQGKLQNAIKRPKFEVIFNGKKYMV